MTGNKGMHLGNCKNEGREKTDFLSLIKNEPTN